MPLEKYNPARGLPQRAALPTLGPAEKFMGAAQQVPRPALAGPAVVPTPAPLVPTPVPAPAAAGPSRAARALTATRGALNSKLAKGGAAFAAAQAVSDSLDDDATAKAATRFGVSEPTGDGSIGDIAKFGALRAGLFASDLGNRLTFGGAGMLYADKQPGATVGNAPAAAQTAPGAAIPATASVGTVQPEKLAGTPMNGFAGVRRVEQPNGIPLFTNATSNAADQAFMAGRGGTVSGGTGGSGGNATTEDILARDQRVSDLSTQVSAMRAGLADRGNINAYTNSASRQPGGISDQIQNEIDRISSGRRRISNGGTAAIAGLLNAQLQNQATLRGQNLEADGRAATLANARVTAGQKQMQDDREYDLKKRELVLKGGEFGAKRENDDFTQRDTAAKSVAARFEKMFTDPEGKTDTEKVGRYMEGMNQAIGNRVATLEGVVKGGGKNAAQAQAELELIHRKGMAAMDEKAIATVVSQMDLGERQKESAGLFGGNYVESSNPDDRRVTGREKNLFGSDTLILGEGGRGGTVREADVKYDSAGNLVIPNSWTKNKSNKYDLAKGFKK